MQIRNKARLWPDGIAKELEHIDLGQTGREEREKWRDFKSLGYLQIKKTLDQFSIESYGFRDLPFLGKPTPKGVYTYIYIYIQRGYIYIYTYTCIYSTHLLHLESTQGTQEC